MGLETQIQSLVFSFVFGLFLSLMFNVFYKYLFKPKLPIKIITNLIFVSINALIYFFLLKIINDGILHSYFLISLLMGFVLGNLKTKVIRKYKLNNFDLI